MHSVSTTKYKMLFRSIHTIFEPSGLPVPTEEDLRFEAMEMVQRKGWGIPLLNAIKQISNPYWREAITRILMERWQQLVKDKDEQTYYYDSDGDIRYCWADADSDFQRIIKRSTSEQTLQELIPAKAQHTDTVKACPQNKTHIQIIIQKNYAPIISNSNVSVH